MHSVRRGRENGCTDPMRLIKAPPSQTVGSSTTSRRKRRWVVPLVVAVTFALLWQTPLIPRYSSSGGPVSVERARRRCPIPLPASARNVQYKTFRFWVAYEEYVRFEAPVEDCVAHVPVVIRQWNADSPSDLRQTSETPQPLEQAPRHPGMLLDVPWFDVENIKKGLSAGAGGPLVPTVWVDSQRGVFYYMVTD